jgi:hypothetical protein
LCSFASCAEEEYNREYNAKEVEDAAEILIEKSLVLNEILYGKGIGYIEDESTEIYKKADPKSLEEFGITRLSDVENKLREVFSKSYVDTVYSSDIFTPLVEDEITKMYARYFEDEDKDEKHTIYVNKCYDFVLENSYEYIGKVKAVRSEGDYVIVSATVRAVRKGDISKDFNLEIKLIEEREGWRLASPTYKVYNEYTDIYEDMTK